MDEKEHLRDIPSVDSILGDLAGSDRARAVPRPLLVRAIRRAVGVVREELLSGGSAEKVSEEELRSRVRSVALGEVETILERRLSPVINATGIIVHTNLGRAPLSARALDRVRSVSCGYSSLEYDLVRGTRGHRDDLVRDYLTELTGAEDALVTNNNAASVLLALNTLALGREVIISRSELIEIGGSFRLPEVFERSGARMVAVGTTNRTRTSDYEAAVRNTTAAIMTAHWSNYSISGFVERVGVAELAGICERRGLPLIHDLGSGILTSPESIGLRGETSVGESLSEGASVVTASGDKILGGPQAGIALGRRGPIARMRANPLMRALRPGKLTLAALEATLEAYLDGTENSDLPVLRMMLESPESLSRRASDLAELLAKHCADACSVKAVGTTARVGGGAAPEQSLQSHGVSLRPSRMTPDALARRLRNGKPPVISRTLDGCVTLDLRTVLPGEEERLAEAVRTPPEET